MSVQHLAEDAEAIAAEDGAMSLASSDGLSMLSAEALQTSTRRRMTSAGIADAEGGQAEHAPIKCIHLGLTHGRPSL